MWEYCSRAELSQTIQPTNQPTSLYFIFLIIDCGPGRQVVMCVQNIDGPLCVVMMMLLILVKKRMLLPIQIVTGCCNHVDINCNRIE